MRKASANSLHHLDIYCGTGSIGLSVARSVREVCGIEVVDAAVMDAKANAKLNGTRAAVSAAVCNNS